MPGYIKNLPQLRQKGVDIVAVVAFNDPFVMSAWGKANQVRGNDIVSVPAMSHARFCLDLQLTKGPPCGIVVPHRSRGSVLQEHWMGR